MWHICSISDWIFASCYWRRYQFETHVVAWTIGAVFVALAVPLSLQDIHMHIIHYISPLQVSGEWTSSFQHDEQSLAHRWAERFMNRNRTSGAPCVIYDLDVGPCISCQ
jgi:hypothetical protein